MATIIDITVNREIKITLDPPGTLQALADALDTVIAGPGVGPNAFVESIRGQGVKFDLALHKPDV